METKGDFVLHNGKLYHFFLKRFIRNRLAHWKIHKLEVLSLSGIPYSYIFED